MNISKMRRVVVVAAVGALALGALGIAPTAGAAPKGKTERTPRPPRPPRPPKPSKTTTTTVKPTTTTVKPTTTTTTPVPPPGGGAWGASCIDTNRDGTCGTDVKVDIPMATALGSGGYWNDDTAKKTSNAILAGTVSMSDYVMIVVKGDIIVNGTISYKGDGYVSLTSTAGAINVKDNTSISSSGAAFDITTYGTGMSTIGNGVKLSETAGSMWDTLSIATKGSMTVGTANAYKGGGDYGTVELRADEMLTLAPGLTFSGPNHAVLSLLSGKNLVVDKLTHKAGYLFLKNGTKNSYLPSGAQHVVYDMTITNSTIQQTYRNGELWLTNSGKIPGSKITITDSKLSAATDDPHAFPLATCTRTTAPEGICE